MSAQTLAAERHADPTRNGCLGCGKPDAAHDTEAHVEADIGAFYWAPICGFGCMDRARDRARALAEQVWDAHADHDHSDVCTADDTDSCEGGCIGETRQVADELKALADAYRNTAANYGGDDDDTEGGRF